MKNLYLIFCLLSSLVSLAQPDIDFSSTQGGYTAGALSKTYSSVGSPPTNATVTVSGVTSGLQSGSPQAFSRGLQLAVNHTTNTACVSVTMRFNAGIQGLTFKLLNVDRGVLSGSLYPFVDQVTVTGLNGAASVSPTISASGSAGNYSTISGNVVTGIGDAPTSSSDPGNVVTFAGTVTEVIVQYCNNTAQTNSDPGPQTMTIEDLSWTGVLPVGLTSFSGKVVGDQVALAWSTAWERNNAYFEVQRSQDAREFGGLHQLAAATQSESRQLYTFLDVAPLNGTSYYRLKQVDAGENGSVTFSKIIAVIRNDDAPNLALLGNPTGEIIRFAHRNIDTQQLRLITPTGVQIPFQIRSESETISEVIPNQPIPSGLYLLTTSQWGRAIALKILKL